MKQNAVLWVIAGLLAALLLVGGGGVLMLVSNQRAAERQRAEDEAKKAAADKQKAVKDNQQAAWDAADARQVAMLNDSIRDMEKQRAEMKAVGLGGDTMRETERLIEEAKDIRDKILRKHPTWGPTGPIPGIKP